MEEIWKPVIGHEERFEVSNLGNIRGLKRIVRNGEKSTRTVKPVTLIPSSNGKGYMRVNLYKKSEYVHRVVGMAFIENDSPEVKKQINHINEDKADNRAENLEWCTDKYNKNFGTARRRMILTRNRLGYNNAEKPIEKYTKSGVYVCEYESQAKAAVKLGCSEPSLFYSIHSKCGLCCGFQWKYKGSDKKIIPYKNKTLRAVYMIDENDKIIKRFDSLSDAAREVNADVSHIMKCCKAERRRCGGHRWKYVI